MLETSGELTAHLTTGAVIIYLIEWLKRSRWVPWLTADTKGLARLANVVSAAAIALGINWSYDAVGGTLVITGLTIGAIAGAGWEFLKQLCVQQLLYDGVLAPKLVRPPEPPHG